MIVRNTCAALLAITLLAACSGKDKKASPGGQLNGAWEIKRAEGPMAETNVGTVYEFNGNKLSFGKEGFTNPGTTEITDSTFSFQAAGNDSKFIYNYKMAGDTLVVRMENSNDQVFYMAKK